MSKLDGIRAGDRVRVTFEGIVDQAAADVGVRITFGADFAWVGGKKNKSDDHFQITRIEPALAIGDEVTILGKHKGKVLGFLSNGNVAVEYQAGDTSWCGPYHPSCLTHA